MTELKLATVDLLPGKEWNAKAAFGDALQRAPIDSPCVALWLENGELKWSSQASRMEIVYMLHEALREAT